MRILLMLFCLTGWLLPNLNRIQGQEAWTAPAYTDSLVNPFKSDKKIIAEAKKIYESACWTCHGLTGRGDGPAATGLTPKPADHSSAKVQHQADGALFWKLSKGRGVMPPFETTLSKQQRWKLVCYIRELAKQNSQH